MTNIKTKLDPIADLDAAQYLFECGLNALNGMHTAMVEGGFKAENFTSGLYFVQFYLSEICEEMRDSIRVLSHQG